MRRAVALGWLLVLPTIALPVWILGADRGWLPEQILPRPADVLQTLRDMLVSGELAQHASYSLLRVVYGFAIGAGAGAGLGVVTGGLSIAGGAAIGAAAGAVSGLAVDLLKKD